MMRRTTLIDHGTGGLGSTRTLLMLIVTATAMLVLLLGNPAQGHDDDRNRRDRRTNRNREVPDQTKLLVEDIIDATLSARDKHWGWMPEEFDDATIIFEENFTDGDLGIQFFLDAEGWRRVMIFQPNGRRMVDIKVRGSAGVIGLTELFSEGAEPNFADIPREELLALFPPGDYKMFGKTVEGKWLVSIATLTHDLPDGPVILWPEEDAEVDPDEPFVIEWGTVADPDAPDSVIEAYQVIVEKDVDDERLRVLSVHMLATDTSFTVAPGFFEPGKEYKVEVLAIETSGNQTISEVAFETEDDE